MKITVISDFLKSRYRIKIDWAFLALLSILVGVNVPFLTGSIIPTSDLLLDLTGFHYFYSSFFYYNAIPQWCPYILYGVPAAMSQWIHFSPLAYFGALVGLLFRVEDVLSVFRFVILLENVFLLMGTYLVARRFYKRTLTVVMVCLGVILSAVWWPQMHFSFRYIYHIPLVLYLLHRFFTEEKAAFLWLAGSVTMLHAIGTAPYFVPFWALIFSLFSLPFFVRNPLILKSLISRERADAAALALFAGLTACIVYFMFQVPDGILNLMRDDPMSIRASLDVMLVKDLAGLQDRFAVFAHQYMTGWPIETDTPVYFGILPFAFLLWGLIKKPGALLIGLTAASLGLILYSFGGMMTWIGFRLFPLLSSSHHTFLYVQPPIKILLLLAAGLGFEHFLEHHSKRYLWGVLVFLLLIGDVFGGMSAFYLKQGVDSLSRTAVHNPDLFASICLWIRIALYATGLITCLFVLPKANNRVKRDTPSASRRKAGRIQGMGLILILCFVFDLALYRYLVHRNVAQQPVQFAPYRYTLKTHPFAYQPSRLDMPQDERAMDALNLLANLALLRDAHGNRSCLYYDYFKLIQSDITWVPNLFRVMVCPLQLAQLFQWRGWDWSNPEGDTSTSFLKVLGCHSPKIRFMDQAIIARSPLDMQRLIGTTPDLSEVLILCDENTWSLPVRLRENNIVLRDLVWSFSNPRFGKVRPPDGFLPLEPLEMELLGFKADEIKFRVAIGGSEDGWLVYADNFTPDWKASVDNQPVEILPAYLAFKAIPISPGTHVVRFHYGRGLMTFLSYMLALIGIVWGGIVAAWFALMLSCHRVCPGRADAVAAKKTG